MTVRNITPNENYEVCHKCGGKCCKKIPGSWAPFQLPEKKLVSLLKENKVTIWCLHDSVLVRPRNVPLHSHDIVTGSYPEGKCVFLSSRGCKLEFAERPLECQGLYPAGDIKHCGEEVKGTDLGSLKELWRRNLCRSPKLANALKSVGIISYSHGQSFGILRRHIERYG